MEAALDPNDLSNLSTSLKKINTLYYKESFNSEKKFCMLRTASMNVPEIALFEIYRGETDY